MAWSRRAFLQQTSTAAALGLAARLPGWQLWTASVYDLLPEPDETLLRELALKAVDAARGAGAGFADVRLGIGRRLRVGCDYLAGEGASAPTMAPPDLELEVGYGIRALVEGAWGFAGSYELTAEAVAAVARAAVARARGNRPRRPRTLELAPAPIKRDGRWATPIGQDPFTVPIGTQGDLQLAAVAEASKLQGIVSAGVSFSWQRADQVFASTEGSLLIQRVYLAIPNAAVAAQVGDLRGTATIEALRRGGFGYEAVGPGSLVSDLRRAAERAVAEAKPPVPVTSAQVGRYDLVFSARAVTRLVTMTVAEALDLERALGYRANAEGTSFAAPPTEMLGKYQVGSTLLTLTAERTRPHAAGTVGWDDEGIAPEEYTLVRDGVIVDYHTNRQTAVALAAGYRQRGERVRSHGCAVGAGQQLPRVHLPNLTLQPAKGSTSVEDLIADTTRGFYIEDLSGRSDQQLLNTQCAGSVVREIRHGKLGGAISDMAFQFITPQFWKSLDAIGGASSATSVLFQGWYDPSPLQFVQRSVSAVPARVRQVNVLNTGRTA